MTKLSFRTIAASVELYFTSWRFPVFMLISMFMFWVLIMFLALMPTGESAWGAFAEDFKRWCFAYDPATGSMEWIYVIMYTVNPLILAVVIVFVWYEQLKEVWMSPSAMKSQIYSSLGLVLAVTISFIMMYERPNQAEYIFRPDAIRVSVEPYDFELVNDREEIIHLSDLQGRVVLLTSFYTSCAETCPLIVQQVKSVLDSLSASERADVSFVAITMMPEKDTPDLLHKVAGFYRMDAYNYDFLTGEPEYVNSVLDKLGFARRFNEETGMIDHANLFLVLDRSGKIAFRFTLGEQQQDWMTQALRLLVQEQTPLVLTSAHD